MTTTKVIIADGQYLSREGLKNLISSDPKMELVGEADNAGELFEQLPSLKPDLVIMDYNQPGHFALSDLRSLLQTQFRPRVLVISSDQDRDHIFSVLQMGINTFLTKNCSRREILNAIQASQREEKFFCNSVLNIILERQVHQQEEEEEDCSPSVLTAREQEIIRLIAGGMSTKAIAESLHLSTHTVYTHRKNIMKKLNINSASEMILYALNSGLVTQE